MAVTRALNVIRITADNDTVAGNINICGIKFIAGTGSPSAAIKADDSSGMTVWETASTTALYEEVEISVKQGIHIDLAGTGSVLYLYTE